MNSAPIRTVCTEPYEHALWTVRGTHQNGRGSVMSANVKQTASCLQSQIDLHGQTLQGQFNPAARLGKTNVA